MDAERELVDTSALAAQVEDTNLRVGHTTVEARLGVRLLKKSSLVLISRSVSVHPFDVAASSVFR